MIFGQVTHKSLGWTHWCKYLNMAEFNLRSSKGGQEEKMAILDKDGILMTAGEYGTILLDDGRYSFGQLPYFLKIPNVREIIYCAAGLCESNTYVIGRNLLYGEG